MDLVIFDSDGVLVDSELITNRVFASMINELGVQVTLEDMFEQFVGRSMTYCCDLIAHMLKKPIPDDFVEQYRIRTTAALHAELSQFQELRAYSMNSTKEVCRSASLPVAVTKKCERL